MKITHNTNLGKTYQSEQHTKTIVEIVQDKSSNLKKLNN